jgi:hypothetical protein
MSLRSGTVSDYVSVRGATVRKPWHDNSGPVQQFRDDGPSIDRGPYCLGRNQG